MISHDLQSLYTLILNCGWKVLGQQPGPNGGRRVIIVPGNLIHTTDLGNIMNPDNHVVVRLTPNVPIS